MRHELLPLLLLKAGSGTLTGRTRFQKLMFLYQMNAAARPLGEFDYFAWDYGPYSKELQEQLEDLVERAWVKEVPVMLEEASDKRVYEYRLTADGNSALQSALASPDVANVLSELKLLFQNWGQKNLDDLIRYVYAEHPEFATKSKLSL